MTKKKNTVFIRHTEKKQAMFFKIFHISKSILKIEVSRCKIPPSFLRIFKYSIKKNLFKMEK